jgi:hypothetical protein
MSNVFLFFIDKRLLEKIWGVVLAEIADKDSPITVVVDILAQ